MCEHKLFKGVTKEIKAVLYIKFPHGVKIYEEKEFVWLLDGDGLFLHTHMISIRDKDNPYEHGPEEIRDFALRALDFMRVYCRLQGESGHVAKVLTREGEFREW